VLSALLLAACSEPHQAGDGQRGGAARTYVHALDGAPYSIDPAQANSLYANFIAVNLYDTLYRYKYLARPYQLEPNLAATLPEFSVDGLTLTIPLKRGVHFIDDPAFAGGHGREVTAQDVVYSIQRHFDPQMRAQGAWLWQERIVDIDAWKERGSDYSDPVAGLTALDDHTLQIRLVRPYPQVVHTLAQGYAAVVPREAVEAYGRGFGSQAVGSGPFRLDSFDTTRAVMLRNPDFRREAFDLHHEGFDPARDAGLHLESLQGREPPFLDRLVLEFISEDAARWNAFRSGQVQFLKVPASQFGQVLAESPPLRLVESLAAQYQLEAVAEAGFVYTNFNMADPRIGAHPDPQQAQRNRALRCAIVKGFDWHARNRMFFHDLGQVFPGIIPPSLPEYDPAQGQDYVQHDPDGARALLAENGWQANNLPLLEYGFPASVTERQMFEQFRGFMQAIGWPADKVQPLAYGNYGEYSRAYSQGQVMLITSSWTLDYPDAENTLQLFYGPNAAPGSNSASFNDPQFNALYAQAAPLPPSPERTSLFRAMNRRVMDECATISGLSRTLLLMWDRQVIMRPDRSNSLGGFFLRFVDLREAATP
jgi:ABC-type transport system substrate-binding protein